MFLHIWHSKQLQLVMASIIPVFDKVGKGFENNKRGIQFPKITKGSIMSSQLKLAHLIYSNFLIELIARGISRPKYQIKLMSISAKSSLITLRVILLRDWEIPSLKGDIHEWIYLSSDFSDNLQTFVVHSATTIGLRTPGLSCDHPLKHNTRITGLCLTYGTRKDTRIWIGDNVLHMIMNVVYDTFWFIGKCIIFIVVCFINKFYRPVGCINFTESTLWVVHQMGLCRLNYIIPSTIPCTIF